MNLFDWQWLKAFPRLLATSRPEPSRQAERIVAMQLHIVFPAKIGVIAVVVYYLSNTGWFDNAPTPHTVVLELLQKFFRAYILANVTAGVLFLLWRRLPAGLFQWLVFTLGLLDGLFIAGLTFLTGGFESIAFWVFPGLIVLNALSIPLAMPQIVLNLLLSFFYLGAGILATNISDTQAALQTVPKRLPATNHPPVEPIPKPATSTNPAGDLAARLHRPPWWNDSSAPPAHEETQAEPFLLRLSVLWLLASCCYGVQVLAERERRVQAEAREFAVREGQLHSAGRLAAEIAHQLKNPLAIINNAVFSLQRAASEGRPAPPAQLLMISEEVGRADRILTDLMGYAQLNEGRVEKLSVTAELDHALDQVFPAAAGFAITIERNYATDLPPLLMQRRHLSGIFVNLFQNAREAMPGPGRLIVSAALLADDAVEVRIRDTGMGMSAEALGKIFEAYFTTKEKGTGLGLALVKHNLGLYSGTVRAESELGKGALFVLTFPARTVTGPAGPV